jgi:catechol 2,3-dioxygenase-like lactoylglutathione lyase family enzyme
MAYDMPALMMRLARARIVLAVSLALGLLAARKPSAQGPAASAGAVISACHISPIVANLDASARFYHDLLGMDLMPPPPAGALPWDTDPGHLHLHGLPDARLRFIQARMPGVRCGIELVEFANVDRTPVRRRYQDPGAATIILLVRDLDASVAALRKGGARVVSTGGAPIRTSEANATRAVTVQDPDGHYIELAQLDPMPETKVAAASNVIGIRLRLTVADVERSLSYYEQVLGVHGSVRPFVRNPTVMKMIGLPERGEYQVAIIQMPGSTLVFELIGFRGLDSAAAPVPSRVQDPGSFRLQLTMGSIDAALAALRGAGAHVISTGGVPVHMSFGGRPWQLSVVPDMNNLFLIVQQAPPADRSDPR